MKQAMYFIGGLCCFVSGLGFGLFLWQYVADGSGLQEFGLGLMVSSGSVLLGLARILGLFLATFLCLAIGINLCAHGLVPGPDRASGNAEKM